MEQSTEGDCCRVVPCTRTPLNRKAVIVYSTLALVAKKKQEVLVWYLLLSWIIIREHRPTELTISMLSVAKTSFSWQCAIFRGKKWLDSLAALRESTWTYRSRLENYSILQNLHTLCLFSSSAWTQKKNHDKVIASTCTTLKKMTRLNLVKRPQSKWILWESGPGCHLVGM